MHTGEYTYYALILGEPSQLMPVQAHLHVSRYYHVYSYSLDVHCAGCKCHAEGEPECMQQQQQKAGSREIIIRCPVARAPAGCSWS